MRRARNGSWWPRSHPSSARSSPTACRRGWPATAVSLSATTSPPIPAAQPDQLCGLCALAFLARTTIHRQRYYSCTGKLPALFSHREHKCRSRLSPAERLDELVWADLCDLLTHPEQVSQALARAHGGQWLPQELRQQRLRRGQTSLGQQIERLTEAYLAGVVLLDEYRRRRNDLDRPTDTARLAQASFEQRKSLVEWSNR